MPVPPMLIPWPLLGSGKLVTPWARMHLLNAMNAFAWPLVPLGFDEPPQAASRKMDASAATTG